MSAMPALFPWFRSDLPSADRYKATDLRIETGDLVVGQSDLPLSGPTVLWEVRTGVSRLRAIKPITVHIRPEGAFWFAENETLHVFAHGSTATEALNEFQEHVVHFHEYYERLRSDQVIGEGARLKRLFAESFERA